MKINDFKTELTASLKSICAEKHWSFDNAKLRGMAFENWCFNLFAERYPAADNDLEESIIRGDDGTIDVVFESKETEEIYILQCKHPKIAQNDPIPEEEVKAFFATYNLLNDAEYLTQAGIFSAMPRDRTRATKRGMPPAFRRPAQLRSHRKPGARCPAVLASAARAGLCWGRSARRKTSRPM
jgi:restriction endonuclease